MYKGTNSTTTSAENLLVSHMARDIGSGEIIAFAFVLLVLGWMTMRYACSSHRYGNDTVYFCPQTIFDILTKLCRSKEGQRSVNVPQASMPVASAVV